jgi:hypothetical protein
MTRVLALVLASLLVTRPATGQVMLQLNAGYLDRRLSEGAALEQQAGPVGGGGITIAAGPLAFSLAAAGGKLRAPSDRLTEDADYGRISGELTVPLAPAVSASAEVIASVFVTRIGAQRWIAPRLSLELRAPFTSIPAAAYLAGSAILGPTTNATTPPKGGLAIRAGVAGHPPVAPFLEYRLERWSFADPTTRREQRGEIMAGLRFSAGPRGGAARSRNEQ